MFVTPLTGTGQAGWVGPLYLFISTGGSGLIPRSVVGFLFHPVCCSLVAKSLPYFRGSVLENGDGMTSSDPGRRCLLGGEALDLVLRCTYVTTARSFLLICFFLLYIPPGVFGDCYVMYVYFYTLSGVRAFLG